MESRAVFYLLAIIGLCVGSFMLRGGMPLLPAPFAHAAALLVLASSALVLIRLFRQDNHQRAATRDAHRNLQREYDLHNAEDAVRRQIALMQHPQDLNDVLREIRSALRQLGVEHDSASIQIVNDAGTDFVSLYPSNQNVTFERILDRHWTRDSNNAADYPWVIEAWKSDQPLYQPRATLLPLSLPEGTSTNAREVSLIDVPFEIGTLAINSKTLDAFNEEHIALLQRMAGLLTEACRRLVEISEHQTLQQQFQNIFDQTHCLAWEAYVRKIEEDNFEWQIRVINEEAAQRFLPLDLAPGQTYADAWFLSRPVEDQEQSDNTSRIAFNTDQTLYSLRFRSLDRDGRMHYLLENTHIERLDAEHWKIIGVANDITEIQETEERFQAAIQNVVDGFTIIDEHGVFEVFNPAAERIFGYTAPEMVGQSMRLLMTEPHRSKSDQYIARFLARGVDKIVGQGIETRGQRKDGTTFPMELAVGEFTVGGRQLFTGVVRDLSERMRDEREQVVLHHIREQIWAMENTGDIDQILFDLHGGIKSLGIDYDNCGVNIVDADADPPLFLPYSIDSTGNEMMAGEAHVGISILIDAWRKREPLYRRDLSSVDEHGEQIELAHPYGVVRSVLDIPFAHGTLAVNSHRPNAFSERDIVSLQELAAVLEEAFNRNSDITTREQYYVDLEREIAVRKRTENDLKEALSAAEAANRAKSEFLANMSHEIRTPMNAVIGMTELALDTALDDAQREYLDIVKTSAYSLLQLIDDILDFSKIEAGQLDLENADFNLRHTVESSVKTLALRAHEKDLELTCQIDAEVADALVGDPLRLRQVLVNLLSNAVKFTETGEIAVSVHSQDRSADQTTLRFEVRDTGVGIPADKHEHIFESFTQVDASTTRRYGGTGLGLSICARIATMMGGRIWVESEEGQGSTFSFTAQFPLQTHTDIPATETPRDAMRGLRVIVVDDNETNRKILTEWLNQWAMRTTAVASGEEAVAAVLDAAPSDDAYAVILLDTMMPDMDGFAVASHLAGPIKDGLIAVMLSSAGDRHISTRYREAGISLYLRKPVSQSELFNALANLVGDPVAIQQPTETRETHDTSLRILIAEDNAFNQKVATGLLEKRGHIITVANNGQEALDQTKRQVFDVVLMDVQMPGIDGLEATRQLRRREEGSDRRIPVIGLTAHAMEGDRQRCIEAGMDDYVAKPIKPQALDKALAIIRSSPIPESEKIVPSIASPAFDRAAVLDRCGGDEDLLGELVSIFRQDLPDYLQRIKTAIDTGDDDELARAAHTLKGPLGTLGFDAAQTLALELETMGRTSDTSEAADRFGELGTELEQIAPLLAELAGDSSPAPEVN